MDGPRSYRSSHNVSRHTVVMRKAKDDDARRVALEDEDGLVVHQDEANPAASLTARGAGTRRLDKGESQRRTVDGRQVIVQHEGTVSDRYSTRLSGERADAVPVAGGDTIIKYKSGDMVIRRGARRARVRRQIIWAYALGYLVLFGLFAYHLLTGTDTITPEGFLAKAFRLRHGSGIMDLEIAALEAMRGNRTPAEIRLAQNLTFYDEKKDAIHIASGARLTLLAAAKLGHAIIEDQEKEPARRTFQEPFKIWKETHLAGVNWPSLLTLYNALGFFLLVILFLWRPIMHYLGTQGKKTAVALRNARDAQAEAKEYLEKYRKLDGEIAERRQSFTAEIEERARHARDGALEDARAQVHELTGSIEKALENEKAAQLASLGRDLAHRACDGARALLEQRLGQADHDAAIDELIGNITALKGTTV